MQGEEEAEDLSEDDHAPSDSDGDEIPAPIRFGDAPPQPPPPVGVTRPANKQKQTTLTKKPAPPKTAKAGRAGSAAKRPAQRPLPPKPPPAKKQAAGGGARKAPAPPKPAPPPKPSPPAVAAEEEENEEETGEGTDEEVRERERAEAEAEEESEHHEPADASAPEEVEEDAPASLAEEEEEAADAGEEEDEEEEEEDEAPAARAATEPEGTSAPAAAESRAPAEEDSDDDNITLPNDMPQHRQITEPPAEPETHAPVDAVKVAESARRSSIDEGRSSATGAGAQGGPELTGGFVDPALLDLRLCLKGEKNDSLALVPMESCVHGLVKDDSANTWPPYEISLVEDRYTQQLRFNWLEKLLQEDPDRMLNTIMYIDCETPEKSRTSTKHRLQAMLPGTLVNPTANADHAKRIVEFNEAMGGTNWTLAIPVPEAFVKQLYKLSNHGLPTKYDPMRPDVNFVLFPKLEAQSAKDPRWRIVVDKSRASQADGGGSGGGSRSKRANSSAAGEGGHKRTKAGSATAVEAAPAPQEPQPPRWQPQQQQGRLENFGLVAAGTAAATAPADGTRTANGPEPAAFPLVLGAPKEGSEDSGQTATLTTLLEQGPELYGWQRQGTEFWTMMLPQVPEGFELEMNVRPSNKSQGMLIMKRAS